jgi:peptidoglycan hydrolase-like protein with peptidoglycan-binding domain
MTDETLPPPGAPIAEASPTTSWWMKKRARLPTWAWIAIGVLVLFAAAAAGGGDDQEDAEPSSNTDPVEMITQQDEVETTIAVTSTEVPTTTLAPPATATQTTAAPTTAVPTTAAPTTTTPPLPEGIQLDDCAAGFNDDFLLNGNYQPCFKGPSIELLQRALVAWDLGESVEIDGYFGPGTQRALLAWQVRHGWPEFPTTYMNKWDPLVGQVFASLGDPALPRTGPCPKPDPVTRDDVMEGQPHSYRPMLALCDFGEPISNMQLVLARDGYQVEQTGIFDIQTAEAVNRYSMAVLGYSTGVTVDWDMWWAVFGD